MYGMTHKSALPDVALYELYDRLKDAGRFHETFYDGEIEDSHHGFRDYARRPDIHLWALSHGGELSGMCWLTHVCHGGTAFAHFAMLPNLHPLVTLRLGGSPWPPCSGCRTNAGRSFWRRCTARRRAPAQRPCGGSKRWVSSRWASCRMRFLWRIRAGMSRDLSVMRTGRRLRAHGAEKRNENLHAD